MKSIKDTFSTIKAYFIELKNKKYAIEWLIIMFIWGIIAGLLYAACTFVANFGNHVFWGM